MQRAPSLSSGLERACVVVLRVRPAIRARHTRVKTGVCSALCKDESEGFEAGQRPEIVKLHAAGNHFVLDRRVVAVIDGRRCRSRDRDVVARLEQCAPCHSVKSSS